MVRMTGRRRSLDEAGRAVLCTPLTARCDEQRAPIRLHSRLRQNFGLAGRAGCNAPYQMERLRSDVAITVSGKKPVTVGSAEATARQGRSRSNPSKTGGGLASFRSRVPSLTNPLNPMGEVAVSDVVWASE